MSLYLTIGDATSATCSVRLTSRTVKPVVFNNFITAWEQDLTVEGYLYASGPEANRATELSNAMYALELAASKPNVNVGISHITTGRTMHWLSTDGAIGGVILKDFKYVDTPLSLVTEIKYSLTASAMYNNASLKRDIVSLEETLSYSGEGGPDIVLAPQAGAPSVYQTISDYTDVKVTQSGRVMARVAPDLPAPLFTTEARDQKASRDTLSYIVKGLDVLMYVREYQYSFQFPSLPTPTWPQRLV